MNKSVHVTYIRAQLPANIGQSKSNKTQFTHICPSCLWCAHVPSLLRPKILSQSTYFCCCVCMFLCCLTEHLTSSNEKEMYVNEGGFVLCDIHTSIQQKKIYIFCSPRQHSVGVTNNTPGKQETCSENVSAYLNRTHMLTSPPDSSVEYVSETIRNKWLPLPNASFTWMSLERVVLYKRAHNFLGSHGSC